MTDHSLVTVDTTFAVAEGGALLYIDSTRDEREIEGLAPHQSDTQLQLSARFYL